MVNKQQVKCYYLRAVQICFQSILVRHGAYDPKFIYKMICRLGRRIDHGIAAPVYKALDELDPESSGSTRRQMSKSINYFVNEDNPFIVPECSLTKQDRLKNIRKFQNIPVWKYRLPK